MTGGGDAASAARAVIVTGKADWAWKLHVEHRSSSRDVVAEQLYGPGNQQAGDTLNVPPRFALKSVDSGVVFSLDAGDPDTYAHIYADIEIYTSGPTSPYPIAWMERFRSDDIAQKSNIWAGTNITRWSNSEFDEDGQLELWTEMLSMVNDDIVEVPIVWRGGVAAVHSRIQNWKSSVFGATAVVFLMDRTL